MSPPKFGFGHAVRRKEDNTLLRGAAEAIVIEWEALAHVVGAAAAMAKAAPVVWPELAGGHGNLAFETELGDGTATARAFAGAAHTVALTVVNQRLVANYLDTR